MKIKIKILYLSLYNLLKKRYGNYKFITKKDIYCELGKHFLVERFLRDSVINELLQMKLIKKIDKKSYKLLEYSIDIETDTENFFKSINFY